MDATKEPDLDILDIEGLLEEAAAAFSGEREFSYYINEKLLVFAYTLKPDSSLLMGVRSKAQALMQITTPPPAWADYWPEQGMTPDLATRLAWGSVVKVRFKGGKEIGDLGLLKIERVAGVLFVMLTDEISVAATGIMKHVETEVITNLGEDSPPTT